MSFIILIVGLIYHELSKKTKIIKGKSIDDRLLQARIIKLNKKNRWIISNAKKDLQQMMEKLNIDLHNPLGD